jgi:hypothetical protein
MKDIINQIRERKLQLMTDIGVLLTKFSDENGVEISDINIDEVVKSNHSNMPLRYFVDVEIKI